MFVYKVFICVTGHMHNHACIVLLKVLVKPQQLLFVDPLGEQRRVINQIKKNWKYVIHFMYNEINCVI